MQRYDKTKRTAIQRCVARWSVCPSRLRKMNSSERLHAEDVWKMLYQHCYRRRPWRG